jgi:CheY-like chemotaxis protein
LYVEDNPDDQLILKHALKENMQLKYDLVTVDTAAKGIKKLQSESFDLVLSDYRLPDMTGIEFIRQLNKTNNSAPIVLLTGKGNENVAVEAMKLGVRDYIVKEDITQKRLMKSINDILLESSLPKNVDIETAKAILALFSKKPIVHLESVSALETSPESEIPAEQLVPALRELSEIQILKKEPSRSVVACPECGSLTSTLHLECPECESNKMVKEEALEHFDCGNIDFRSKYDKGEGRVVCPKCGKKLKVIGVDYRKIENWYKCSNSHHFGQPNLKFVCSKCNGRFPLEETRIDTLHHYTLTSNGKQMLNLGVKAAELNTTKGKSGKKL